MAVRNLYKPEQEPMRQYTSTSMDVKPVFGVVANCDRLNVRKKPHRGQNVLTVIEEDEIVEITMHKSTKNWYFVKTESGVEGYCMADYIVRKR